MTTRWRNCVTPIRGRQPRRCCARVVAGGGRGGRPVSGRVGARFSLDPRSIVNSMGSPQASGPSEAGWSFTYRGLPIVVSPGTTTGIPQTSAFHRDRPSQGDDDGQDMLTGATWTTFGAGSEQDVSRSGATSRHDDAGSRHRWGAPVQHGQERQARPVEELASLRSSIGVAVGDGPAAVGVLVLEDPVDHAGDGLEAPGGLAACTVSASRAGPSNLAADHRPWPPRADHDRAHVTVAAGRS
jgi:hypothetical protein